MYETYCLWNVCVTQRTTPVLTQYLCYKHYIHWNSAMLIHHVNIYIYIYVYLTNGSEYTTVIDIYIGRKLATDPSAEHSQMESPASLYKFDLSIPRPPPRLPYRDPVTSGGGNRRIPLIHNDITNIRIPFYALLHSGQKWTLCDMCWITHDVHVVWHTIAVPDDRAS